MPSASASSEGSMVNLHFAHEVVVPVQLLAHDLVGRLVMVLFKEVKSADILQQSVGNLLRNYHLHRAGHHCGELVLCPTQSTMSDNGDMTEHTHTHHPTTAYWSCWLLTCLLMHMKTGPRPLLRCAAFLKRTEVASKETAKARTLLLQSVKLVACCMGCMGSPPPGSCTLCGERYTARNASGNTFWSLSQSCHRTPQQH